MFESSRSVVRTKFELFAGSYVSCWHILLSFWLLGPGTAAYRLESKFGHVELLPPRDWQPAKFKGVLMIGVFSDQLIIMTNLSSLFSCQKSARLCMCMC